MKSMLRGLVMVALMISPVGCCTARDEQTGVSVDSYKAAITKVRSNIAEIRSDVATVTYEPAIKAADLQLIDATIALCDDTLAGKTAGAEPTAPTGSGQ